MKSQTVLLVWVTCVLAACSTQATKPAPIEDRKPNRVLVGKDSGKPAASSTGSGAGTHAGTGTNAPNAAGSQSPPAVSTKGAENAGKPGYYTVKPGDTLYRIGLENGQAWKDVARWNELDSPFTIEVGQVLRVATPSAANPAWPLKPSTSLNTPPIAAANAPSSPTAVADEETPVFIWPATGAIVAGFDESKNKGLDIGGKVGDAVLAAADGRVVYAGAGLRGYGNLLIVKHNGTFLTAYAHNQALLVKEEQTVKKGQKIAEMGNSDSERVKLHFEIRRQGKPVDPAKYLSAR
jgi:lipoprotein NlpD